MPSRHVTTEKITLMMRNKSDQTELLRAIKSIMSVYSAIVWCFPCRYELGASCRPCLCLFSFIYTLRCTLCVREGWHDSNIHKLTNTQWWSGTSTLWKDAKQKTSSKCLSVFDTVNAGNSKKKLLFSSFLFALKGLTLVLFYNPDSAMFQEAIKLCRWNRNLNKAKWVQSQFLCKVLIHEFCFCSQTLQLISSGFLSRRSASEP